jgi:adenine-specific DNA-methyltransferase
MTISETKFNDLKAKLRELFELDKSDLDFGIYRIMAAKNKEVTEFLDHQLKTVVRETLAAHGAGVSGQVQAELDKVIAGLKAAEIPDDEVAANKKVTDLRAKLATSGGSSAAELEADIYNHLLAFFGRYYDEGDFISQRRYKGDTYAIPYSGEEVTLYWANKDQYYIKSGEWHKDYRFKIPGGGDKTVRFKLVEATQEVGNNKEAEDAKRRYILAAENPIEESTGELALRFEFRAPKPADIERAAAGAVAIFGGDYAKPSKPKKGEEREQFCADAEKRALVAMSAAWKGVATAASPTEGKPARTVLGKHLDDFTARNTFDYFIHKDLGGFLGRELDFYLKNEVVRLDDLESLPPDHLQRVQGKVKAIRVVASRIIAFLASVENFQKRMWLKKKLVLNTNWLVTVDRIPSRMRDAVANCEAQWKEWESLGFKPEEAGRAGLFGGARWGTREYLDACDKLPVDTRHFDTTFTSELLASEESRGTSATLDEATTGVLVNGDNFHAVGVLGTVLNGRVKCVYIDPPYNAPRSEIAYKNSFKHSSFLSLIDSRLRRSRSLNAPDGSHVVAIDKNEGNGVHRLINQLFPTHDVVSITVEHNRKGIQDDHFSFTHEYAIFAMPAALKELNETVRPEADWEYSNFRNWGGESLRTDAANCFYAVLVRNGAIIGFGDVWVDESMHPAGANVRRPDGIIEVYPIDGQGVERKWRYERGTVEGIQRFLRVEGESEGVLQIKIAKASDQFKTVWYSPRYNAGDNGTRLARNMGLPLGEFDYPKSVFTVRDCIFAVTDKNGLILDYFAGSGTTGQAALMLNREDGGHRRFTLVEMGAYFATVVRPRIAKAAYCSEWAEGRPQSHDGGLSALVKSFALESYDDALNNLPAPSGQLLDGRTAVEKDALITYALDLELGPCLLELDAFRDPWGYTIKAQLAGHAEIKRHRVDLVETFNYLIGLKVHAYGPLEQYGADFERAAHADGLGRMKLTGRLRRDANGPYVFQRVEGELNDGNSTRVLVVWRKLTDDPEKDAAVLDAWMARHRESTRERTEHRDYHLIYINGPVTLPQPTAEIRSVFPTEETFKIKMFEDTDGSGGA